MHLQKLPVSVAEFTPELFTLIIQKNHPETVIDNVEIIKTLQYGEGMVSTAARAILKFSYKTNTAEGLPTRVILKLAYDLEDLPSPLYANEVNFYNRLRNEINIETPRTIGAYHHPESRHFALLLEDLTEKSATFPNALSPLTVAQAKTVLNTLASLHARYWQAPRFDTDMSWLETHVTGDLADFMNQAVPHVTQQEINTNSFKHELVAKMNTTGDELLKGLIAVQRHQASLQQTLLHGDAHIGNVYLLPDGIGMLD